MKNFFSKLIIYFLLITGSAIFLVPLFWMMSTALKPIDQTMSMPPTWVPYRLYAEIDGKPVSVNMAETIETPSVVITIDQTAEKRIVTPDQIVKGKIADRTKTGETVKQAVTVVREVPASRQEPWVRVIPEDVMAVIQAGKSDAESSSLWEVVPKSSLVKKTALRWDNFSKAVRAMKYFPMYLKNTLILCVLTVIGTVFSSALSAYGFARIPWRGRNKFFLIALATMMIPFPVVMVPIYCMFKSVGWIGTLRPLWVGSFCAGAFNVFLLRQFFMTIPKDLSDAARIDGCSEFRIFWQIILPLCRPALMVVGLFQFMGTWNDFLGPLIYLTNQKDFTLALGLQFFQSQQGGTEWHYLMAASTLVVLPIIVLFFFTQKTFIEGISMTGLKG